MKKEKKPEVVKTCLDIIPVRSWDEETEAFRLADGSYMDMYRVIPRDLQNIAEDELELEIFRFTKLLKTVSFDLKFVSMRFPLSLARQKEVLRHHRQLVQDAQRRLWLDRQLRELELVETSISSQHFYLIFWGKDADTLRKNREVLRKQGTIGTQPMLEQVDSFRKRRILEKLCNMNSIIEVYPDAEEDGAGGYMEEDGNK